MPTKPFEQLLYRELAKASAKEIIAIASPLLQELVNYATNAFQRCQTSSTGKPDEDLPILILYLHVIEMTDAIEALISQSCPIPAILLLRSSFEAQLAIDYILEADYQRRSFAWLVEYLHHRLNQYRMLGPSQQGGKDFLAALSADEIGRFMRAPLPDLPPKAIENLESLLGTPNYQIAEAEYQKVKKTRKRMPAWYSLFGGPRSLRELAKHVNRPAQYDFLYRQWSRIIHAGDLSRFLRRTSKGDAAFKPLRNHEEMAQVSQYAASFILDATRKVLGKFRPGEADSVKRWYVAEVRDRYLMLSKVNLQPIPHQRPLGAVSPRAWRNLGC